jgi:hypothetical protein
VNADRTAFCRSLRDTRLRRELTLEAIADSTKIGAALLADLERGDLSRWPKGLFQRAFLREYAAAIGLPPEQVVNDVRRLFPDESGAPPSEPLPADGLRLMLAPDHPSWFEPTARRAVIALLDVIAVLLVGLVIATVASGSVALVTAVVGLIYYGAATLLSGTTPASLLFDRKVLPLTLTRNGFRSKTAVERPRLVFSGPGPSAAAEDRAEAPASHESLRPTSHAARR